MFGFRNKVKENSDETNEFKILYRIREEQYNLGTSKFIPEACYNITWYSLSYKNYGINLNGKDYCDSYEDAVYVIDKHKISHNIKLIKEIIHEIE